MDKYKIQRQEIVEQREAGCSLREISSLLGVHLSSIRYILCPKWRRRALDNTGKWNRTKKGMAYFKEYNQRPEVIERRKRRNKKRYWDNKKLI